ncbi:hypothetical protein BKA64DRAFT_329426 [Cadophora sp. MPI-SDFR-AT-0126]|nr:hypothetical protein BKA64DRAFT_329426 [Leotiomycetes sp. MPI-SDFR-AT-0126]
MDCKIEGRKYVLVSQPSRWQTTRERVVVQSPMLNISKDVALVPVRRFNGEQQNVVCFLPRTDFEKDSSDAYQRSHVNKSPSSIEAHGTAICDSSPSNEFSYRRNDRFWIYIDSRTEEYKNTVPVINLRTYQSGLIQLDHVCWFPRICSTSICSVTKATREQLWTPGGSARQCKLSGSKKYAQWSYVVCQYTVDTKPIGKSVLIPAKDNQSEETRHLSVNESNVFFQTRWRRMVAELDGSCASHPPTFPLPTPSASLELEISRKPEKGKELGSNRTVPVPIDEDFWARIQDMANHRASRSKHYVLRNSPTHPQKSLSIAGSEDRGRSTSISIPRDEYDSDWSSDFDSISNFSRDISPNCISDAENPKSALQGQFLHEGNTPWEVLRCPNANGLVLQDRPDGLAFSAADPSIAKDPTRIRAEWEANRPDHNPMLDDLCQNKVPLYPYTTKYTCQHFHPDPAKCLLDNKPLLELSDHGPMGEQLIPGGEMLAIEPSKGALGFNLDYLAMDKDIFEGDGHQDADQLWSHDLTSCWEHGALPSRLY